MDLLNIYISLIAWLAFNLIKFTIEKDKYDDQDAVFPLKTYIRKTWDNWLASLFMIPVLLWIGYRQLNIVADPLSEHVSTIVWNDLYYLLSGIITEIVIDRYKAWKK